MTEQRSSASGLVPAEDIAQKMRESGLVVFNSCDVALSALYRVYGPMLQKSPAFCSPVGRNRLKAALDRVAQRLYDAAGVDPADRIPSHSWHIGLDAQNARSERLLVMGPPGHGKTSVLREVARLLAEELDMRFVADPATADEIDERTFVFFNLELAGEISAASIKGIPSVKKDDSDKDVIVYAHPPFVEIARKSGAFVLNLDEINNAPPHLRAALHGLLLEGGNVFTGDMGAAVSVVGTGNIGRVDGTDAIPPGSALLGRFGMTVGMIDDVDQFLARTRAKYGPGVADVLHNYFKMYSGDSSLTYGATGVKSGVLPSKGTSARDWDRVLDPLHPYIGSMLDGSLDAATLGMVKRFIVEPALPASVADEFFAFLQHLSSQVTPLVREAYDNDGLMNESPFARILQSLRGDGLSATANKEEVTMVAANLCAERIISCRTAKDAAMQIAHFVRAMARMKIPDSSHWDHAFSRLLSAIIERQGRMEDTLRANLLQVHQGMITSAIYLHEDMIAPISHALRDMKVLHQNESWTNSLSDIKPRGTGPGQQGLAALFGPSDPSSMADFFRSDKEPSDARTTASSRRKTASDDARSTSDEMTGSSLRPTQP